MLSILSFLFACSDAPEDPSEQSTKPVTTTQPVQPKPVLTETRKVEKPASPPVSKTFDPLVGKSLQDICASDGLSLIKWSYEDRQSKHQELCCGEGGFPEDAEECIFDWPFSDVPSCSAYDQMRNEIFAQYGRGFKTEKWQNHFGAQDWYQIRDDYTDEWLSPVAQANVKSLIEKKANKVGCMD